MGVVSVGVSGQREEALRQANAVRVERAALKRQIRSGELCVSIVLLDPPVVLSRLSIYDLLVCVPGVGARKAARGLKECRVSSHLLLGETTSRQRNIVAEHFSRRARLAA